jgi:hypothetical protein
MAHATPVRCSMSQIDAARSGLASHITGIVSAMKNALEDFER